MQQALPGADALVMTAAVADYRPADPKTAKVKRAELGGRWQLDLVANPDLLSEIGAARKGSRPLLVGFALETESGPELVRRARAKLEAKRVDLVVANNARDAFDGDDNRVTLVTAIDERPLASMSKRTVADHILDWIAERWRS